MTSLTSNEFLSYGGDICPSCKGEGWVDTQAPTCDGAITCYIKAECGYCGATWEEWYTLRGYMNLREGK